jgi:hypothetical protein
VHPENLQCVWQINASTTNLVKTLQERTLRWLQSSCMLGAQNMPDSGEALNEHGSYGNSRMKLACSSMESFPSDSRVGASQNSMAHEFSILRDSS